MKIATKLAVMSGTGAAMLALMAGLQFWVTTANDRQSRSVRRAHAQVAALSAIEVGLVREMKEALEVFAVGSALSAGREEVKGYRRQVRAALARLAEASRDQAQEVARVEEDLRRTVIEVEANIDRMLDRLETGEHGEAEQPDRALAVRVDEVDARLAQLIKPAVEQALARAAQEEELQASYSRRARALAIAPPLLGTVLMAFIARRIRRPLLRNLSLVTQATARINRGDLSTPVPVLEKDELGDLAGSFNLMLGGLRELDVARERLAKTAADLDRSNRELESFAQVVSHDLRAPLRALSSYSRFLVEDCAASLDNEGLQYVEGIAKNASRMDALVVGLLEYSRIGRVEAESTSVNLGDLLDRVVTTLGLREKADVELPSDAPTIWGRALRLEQIFSNLMDNAVKYQPKGARPQVAIEWADRGGCWEFAVRDNGIGIDLKFKDKLFGMFQRLHADGEYEGTGIGLAIVKKAVEEHGGTIWVESAPGQGSVFRFTIAKPEKNGPRQAA